jgi:hypothetical protein
MRFGKRSRQIEPIEIKGSHAVLWRDKGSKESQEAKVLIKTIEDIEHILCSWFGSNLGALEELIKQVC